MSTIQTEGPAILQGYPYRLEVETQNTAFPTAAIFLSHVRSKISSDSIICTLTTRNNGLRRITDKKLQINISAEQTKTMDVGSVWLDIVRTDLEQAEHMKFILEIPVMQTVTRIPEEQE